MCVPGRGVPRPAPKMPERSGDASAVREGREGLGSQHPHPSRTLQPLPNVSMCHQGAEERERCLKAPLIFKYQPQACCVWVSWALAGVS